METILINPDGLTAKAKNPFEKQEDISSYNDIADIPAYLQIEHDKFEANNPSYPLTEPGEPGKEVNADLVHQVETGKSGQPKTYKWNTVNEDKYENALKYAGKKYTRIAWQVVSKEETPEKKNEWVKITEDNLPSDLLICQWKHPEYGIITGNIVRYSGQRPDYKETQWIYPNGGNEADIALREFTHYRKINKTSIPQAVTEQSSIESLKDKIEDLQILLDAERKYNDPESIVGFVLTKSKERIMGYLDSANTDEEKGFQTGINCALSCFDGLKADIIKELKK